MAPRNAAELVFLATLAFALLVSSQSEVRVRAPSAVGGAGEGGGEPDAPCRWVLLRTPGRAATARCVSGPPRPTASLAAGAGEWRCAQEVEPQGLPRSSRDIGLDLVEMGQGRCRVVRAELGAGERLALGLPLDLNRASAEELALLPGIGPALSRGIVQERRRRGGFRSTAELEAVRGIGPRKLAALAAVVEVVAFTAPGATAEPHRRQAGPAPSRAAPRRPR